MRGLPSLSQCLPPAVAKKVSNDRRLTREEAELVVATLRRLLADMRRRRAAVPDGSIQPEPPTV